MQFIKGRLRLCATVVACALVRCGQVERDAPVVLPMDRGGAGGISANAGNAGVQRNSAGGFRADAFGGGGAHTSLEGGSSVGGDNGGQAGQAGAEGGSAGDRSDTGIAITGKLIDVWWRPVSGCAVTLGNATTVTGPRGEFRFEHVTPPYDIAFTIAGVPNTSLTPELWLYTGLTRADPTLQFDRVVVDHRTSLLVERTNIPAIPGASPRAKLGLGMSFAAPGLELGASDLIPNGGFVIQSFWSGEVSLSGIVHSLAWLSPSGDPGGLDLEFLSYREQPFTLTDDSTLEALTPRVTLDFSPNAVSAELYPVKIRGELPLAETVLRSEVVFDSNAAIGLTWRAYPEAMNYVPMPVLPGGHAVFAASRQGSSRALVHRRADSSATVTELEVPTPRTLTSPDDGAEGVTALTRFDWSDDATVSILNIQCGALGLQVNVVTAGHSATWSEIPLPLGSLPSGVKCRWRVDVQGAFTSIDDAAGPRGLIDACDSTGTCERDHFYGDGSWTRSSPRTFTTAP